MQKNTTCVSENDASTLGLGLDLDACYQEAEKVGHPVLKSKLWLPISYRNTTLNARLHIAWFLCPMQEMLFRRTCKLVELEAVKRNAEKAKPVKKAAVSVWGFPPLWPAGGSNTLPTGFPDAGIVRRLALAKYIIMTTRSPSSSDGGGEESSRGWVWTHQWSG